MGVGEPHSFSFSFSVISLTLLIPSLGGLSCLLLPLLAKKHETEGAREVRGGDNKRNVCSSFCHAKR